MILLGSRALSIVAPHVLLRKPKDFDFLCHESELAKWKDEFFVNASQLETGKFVANVGELICEFEIINQNDSSFLLEKIIQEDPESKMTDFGMVPSLDVLFAIKTSHRFRKDSPHFWKTLTDWHAMKNAGAKVQPEHFEFVKTRSAEVAKATPKLNVDKKAFFNSDEVPYIYDHDSIHISVAGKQKPAYMSYIKDGQEVLCSKEKWDKCDFETKIRGVLEETSVLAIERSLVPFKNANPKTSWMFAFSKVCTSITSGWFREFAYQNAPLIVSRYTDDFWNDFCEDVNKGKIKSFS
jgi:hypothetical protein